MQTFTTSHPLRIFSFPGPLPRASSRHAIPSVDLRTQESILPTTLMDSSCLHSLYLGPARLSTTQSASEKRTSLGPPPPPPPPPQAASNRLATSSVTSLVTYITQATPPPKNDFTPITSFRSHMSLVHPPHRLHHREKWSS